MLIDRLNFHGFDFDKLPDSLKIDIDLLTGYRKKTGTSCNQKLGALDLAIFQSIESLNPKNEQVQLVRSEYEFNRIEDSNNGFNSKGLVQLNPEQFEKVLTADEVSSIGNPSSMKTGGKVPEAKKSISDIKNINTKNLVNDGHFKIGYRKQWLDSPILVGRAREIVLPNGEQHDALFAIVELDELLASHNQNTFANQQNYPKTKSGRNINDRNYSDDKNAQLKVQTTAQQLNPNLIISTGVDSEGTPIVSIDGVVVSGNNRTMSLKLAKKDFFPRYQDYSETLYSELKEGGYGLYGIDIDELEEMGFTAPVLVRIDLDFQSYTTEELNKFNVDSKKSERPIDKAIRISQQLEDNSNCKTALINLVSTQDTVSELHTDKEQSRRLKTILLDCGLVSNNEVAKYFNQAGLTDDGKTMFMVILSSLVLSPKALQISQNDGVKRSTRSLVNGIIPTIKNQTLKIGNLSTEINDAILLQNKVVSSEIGSITQYISEPEIFESDLDLDLKSAVISLYLSKGGNSFKQMLLTYNNSMEQNQSENMFGDPIPPSIVFYETFVENLSYVDKILVLNRFNDYVAGIEIALEDYRKALKSVQGDQKKELEEFINSLVELRNFAI